MVAPGDPATFGLLLLAYAESRPGPEYSLLVVGEEDVGVSVLRRAAAKLSIEVISQPEASGREFEALVVHSYLHRSSLKQITESIRHRELWYYADSFRNGFIFPDGADLSRSRLIYFGWAHEDPTLTAHLASPPAAVEVVPLSSVERVWGVVGEVAGTGTEAPVSIGRHDLLVAMRYWGTPPWYPTRRRDSILDSVADAVVSTVDHDRFTRVVVKPDPRSLVSSADVMRGLRDRLGPGREVIEWDEPEAPTLALGSLNVLDRYLFGSHWVDGAFFGFDGTPNPLVGLTQPGATIIWPVLSRLDSYFSEPHASEAVHNAVVAQQEVVARHRAGAVEPVIVSRSDTPYRWLFDRTTRFDEAAPEFLRATVDRIASTVELGADPDLHELVSRVEGIRRDRIDFENAFRHEVQRVEELTKGNQEVTDLVHRLEAEVGSLTVANAENLAAIQRQDGEIAAGREEVAAARLEHDATRLELEATRHDLDGAREEIHTTRRELDGTRTELDAVRHALEATRHELDTERNYLIELHNSRSWRWSRPIRLVGKVARAMRANLRGGAN